MSTARLLDATWVAGAIRLPLRTEPWPRGRNVVSPCPVCGGAWAPWAGSLLPCHARCLLTAEACRMLLADPRGSTTLARELGLSLAIVRASLRRARRLT